MKTITKIILAALYIGCLFAMPYGYYELIRVASLIGYSYLIYVATKSEHTNTFIIPMIGLIVFNPIEKITFKREVWNVIDLIFAVVLLVWAIIEIFQTFVSNKVQLNSNVNEQT